MARQANGILGSIQGGISFIYGYRRYAKTIISHKPDWSKVFPSEKVQNHRDRFLLMTNFSNFLFFEVLKVAVIGQPSKLSQWNWFCKHAFQWFNSTNLLVINNLQMSLGSLDPPEITQVQWSAAGKFMIVFWSIPSDPFNPSNNNLANIVVYNIKLNEFIKVLSTTIRKTGFFRLDYPFHWDDHDDITTYLYFTYSLPSLNASSTANRALDL